MTKVRFAVVVQELPTWQVHVQWEAEFGLATSPIHRHLISGLECLSGVTKVAIERYQLILAIEPRVAGLHETARTVRDYLEEDAELRYLLGCALDSDDVQVVAVAL